MISVVIASHNNPQGCYLTAYAVKRQLEGAALEHEIVLVSDGGTETKWEHVKGTYCLRLPHDENASPQRTRDAGIRSARAKDVLCIEDHVVVSDIARLLREHKESGAVLTFPKRCGEGTELFDVYGQEVDWDGNLWHKRLLYSNPRGNAPSYRVAQFGHSCFVVDRNWYVESEGYTDLLRGWGGEEPFLCLKAWMLGGECWLVDNVWHAHYLTPGAHAGVTGSLQFAGNMLTTAYLLGGEKQLAKAQRRYPATTFVHTHGIEAERQRICSGPFHGDLDALREKFRELGVVN